MCRHGYIGSAFQIKNRRVKNAEAQTGKSGPEVSALGLGCMGMSFSYARQGHQGDDRTSQAAVERGITFFRYSRGLRPVHKRRTRGRSPCPFPRESGHRYKFGFDLSPDFDPRGMKGAARPEQPSCAHQAAVEGSLKRLKVMLSTSSISTGLIRTYPSKTWRAGQGPDSAGQGEALRPFGSGSANDPPRARRPAGHRPPERILAVDETPEKEMIPSHRGTRDRLVPTALWQKASSRGNRRNATFDNSDSVAPCPALRRMPSGESGLD